MKHDLFSFSIWSFGLRMIFFRLEYDTDEETDKLLGVEHRINAKNQAIRDAVCKKISFQSSNYLFLPSRRLPNHRLNRKLKKVIIHLEKIRRMFFILIFLSFASKQKNSLIFFLFCKYSASKKNHIRRVVVFYCMLLNDEREWNNE